MEYDKTKNHNGGGVRLSPMLTLLKNRSYTDLIIKIDGSGYEFKVHKAIVDTQSNSKLLQGMIRASGDELVLPASDPLVVAWFIAYIYDHSSSATEVALLWPELFADRVTTAPALDSGEADNLLVDEGPQAFRCQWDDFATFLRWTPEESLFNRRIYIRANELANHFDMVQLKRVIWRRTLVTLFHVIVLTPSYTDANLANMLREIYGHTREDDELRFDATAMCLVLKDKCISNDLLAEGTEARNVVLANDWARFTQGITSSRLHKISFGVLSMKDRK